MFGIIQKIFIALLNGLVNACNHRKSVSLSNQKSEIQPTFINLHPNEKSQEFHYPFTIKLDKCVGRCNTLNDLSNKMCIPNKTEDLNLSPFDMITGINESKTLKRHVSCKCKCKFDKKISNFVIQINSGITINVDVSVKNIINVKKIIFGILVHVFVKKENIQQVLSMIK